MSAGTVETIDVHPAGFGDQLAGVLFRNGLRAEAVADDRLSVSFATAERDRLVAEVTQAIESWLAERSLPLVVEHANGGCVLRPPGD